MDINSDDDVNSNSDVDTKLLRDLNKNSKQMPIRFNDSSYRQHAKFLPVAFEKLVKSVAEAMEAVDSERDLLESYMAFMLLYFNATCEISTEHQRSYATFEAGMIEEDVQLFSTMKKAASELPSLSNLYGSREKEAMKIYLKIADDCQKAKSLGVWMLFDFIFRYFGNYEAVAHLFWMDKAAEQDLKHTLKAFYENAIQEEDLSKFVQQRMREVVTSHTTIAAWFQQGDGRRRTFRKEDARLKRYDLCSKYMDHLISAIPFWLPEALMLGEELWRVNAALVNGYKETEDYLEELLISLSRTTLIGRKVGDHRPIGEHLCSYALTSISGDMYYVLANLNCTRKKNHEIIDNCACANCITIREMKNNYVFMGPSPLILHATLSNKRKPNGHRTLEALRKVRQLLCAEMRCYVDLNGIQMSSCLWRHWLRSIQKGEAAHYNNQYRLMCQLSLRMESNNLIKFRQWLSHIKVLDHIDHLPIQLKCKFYSEFERTACSKKNDVMKALQKMTAFLNSQLRTRR